MIKANEKKEGTKYKDSQVPETQVARDKITHTKYLARERI